MYFFIFRIACDGFREYFYELQIERYFLQRNIPYQYAVLHVKNKRDLQLENYKTNNRHLMVEMNKVNKKGRPQKIKLFNIYYEKKIFLLLSELTMLFPLGIGLGPFRLGFEEKWLKSNGA